MKQSVVGGVGVVVAAMPSLAAWMPARLPPTPTGENISTQTQSESSQSGPDIRNLATDQHQLLGNSGVAFQSSDSGIYDSNELSNSCIGSDIKLGSADAEISPESLVTAPDSSGSAPPEVLRDPRVKSIPSNEPTTPTEPINRGIPFKGVVLSRLATDEEKEAGRSGTPNGDNKDYMSIMVDGLPPWVLTDPTFHECQKLMILILLPPKLISPSETKARLDLVRDVLWNYDGLQPDQLIAKLRDIGQSLEIPPS